MSAEAFEEHIGALGLGRPPWTPEQRAGILDHAATVPCLTCALFAKRLMAEDLGRELRAAPPERAAIEQGRL
jgi:hypothetical protein